MAKKGFIAEFKEFISRGNVMDMAVGVIIGGAFQAIINSLVNDVVMPILSVITGGTDFSEWKKLYLIYALMFFRNAAKRKYIFFCVILFIIFKAFTLSFPCIESLRPKHTTVRSGLCFKTSSSN